MVKNYLRIIIITFLLLWVPISALTEKSLLVIKGGEIHTISAGVIQDGMIFLENGKIRSVGKNISIPKGARIIDADGLIVTPGIIDARSRFSLRVPRRSKNFFNSARKAIDFFKPVEESTWLKCGVTATYITPPAQDLLGGFGAVVKLVGGKEEAVVSDAAGMSVSFGESALKGLNTPTTRQGRVGRLRQEFVRANEYKELGKKGAETETADPQYEAILRVLSREVPLRVFANNPDDIMTSLRFAKEFNLRIVIDSGAAAHRVARFLAKAQVPVVVGPSIMGLGSGGPLEMIAHTPENAGRLYRAGVKVALSTDSRGGRSVLSEGVIAKSHGLPEDIALRAVTLSAAEILGVADRLGSIEPGKDADIIIWKGHPLNTWGETRIVIVSGKVVYER
ncbi:MAG: amidohydrolase family protein [Candidatus Aminicenantes bacterium]|nr:MAG: amidohydrolase family protein [Candidatus Aminicenantes bacterium]